MNPDARRWERIQELFHDALDRPASERSAYLGEAAGDDTTLVADVEALLAEDARGGSILERPMPQIARDVLDGSVPTVNRIGHYRILSVLGHGGMGVVYLAEREDLGSRAAIKVLRDASLSPARRERFALEQRLLAQLSHPAIARLYDADVLPDGTPYFVMEHVDGVSLSEHVASAKPGVAARLRLFRAICEAVQFAHRHAIVHRDLKPSNVLVTPDGTIKLLDFGISKSLGELDRTDPTLTGLRIMTPAYAAPEQILGEPVGIYTDIYALGVMLYELLAGRLPYDLSNRTPGQAEQVVLEHEPARPSAPQKPGAETIDASLSRAEWADLDVLCLTAMHRDPQRRYRTVEALIRDVDHYLDREPLDARPDSFGYRTGKLLRRRWREVAAAGAIAAVLVLLTLVYTVRLTIARDAALAQAARTQRIQQFVVNLFNGGDADAGPADTLRVITLLDRGARQANMLDAEPGIQAELYATLGGIFQQLGDIERADSLLQRSLVQRRALFGTEHTEVASSLISLGLLKLERSELEEAERDLNEALATLARTAPRNHPLAVEARLGLGKTYEAKGDYDRAVTVLDSVARAIEVRDPKSRVLAEALGELANTHYYAGRLDVSDSINRRVIEMDRRLFGERHPHVADDLVNLGAIQNTLGNYEQALDYYREAYGIYLEFYGIDHVETASTAMMMGQALQYLERYDEAIAMSERGLAVRERVYGPNHPLVATALNQVAMAHLAHEDFGEAERSFRRVIDIYRANNGDRHKFVAIGLSNLASVYMAAGEYTRAEPIYRDVIARLLEAVSPEDLNIGIARIKLGRVLVRQGRHAEAEPESLAGYEQVSKQANPTVSWLRSARTDLAEIYDRLGQPRKAERYRAEQKEVDAEASKPKG